MNIITMFFIAVGLAMDAFAVSITSGVTIRNCGLRHALLIALFFGGFQAAMPVVGWLAGLTLKDLIINVDHWIAFGLLCFIGGKMVYESTVIEKAERECKALNFYMLLGLSVATSIDALAVGVTFGILGVLIVTPVAIIGLVTFLMSFIGVSVGRRVGSFFEGKMEVAGGLILITIGVKILVEHLCFGG
jgi:putative Mn2+ efflux pump MntP